MAKVEIVGFHGTLYSYALKIKANGFNLPAKKYKHDHWLGHGVYFYSDFFSANYWAITKTKKKGTVDEQKCIIQAEIICDNDKVIDFDDPCELRKYNLSIIGYNKLITENNISLNFSKGLDKRDRDYKKS